MIKRGVRRMLMSRTKREQRRRFGLGLTILLFPVVLVTGCARPGAEESYARAASSFANHDYREAAIHARNALQSDSDHIEARLLLGRSMLALADLEDAEYHLSRARDAGSAPASYAAPLAQVRAAKGDVAGAIALLDSVPPAERSRAYWISRADLLLRAGELDAAKAALDQADRVEAGSSSSDALLPRARLALMQREVASADSTLREALRSDPSDPEAWSMSAALALIRGGNLEAEAALDRAADLYRARGQVAQASDALLQLVQVQLSRQDAEAAGRTAERLSRIAPGSWPAHYAAGQVAMQLGDPSSAVNALRAASAIAPKQPQVAALLGSAYLATESYRQAEAALLVALDSSPATPAVVRMLCEARLRQGRIDAALDAVKLVRRVPGLDKDEAYVFGVALLMYEMHQEEVADVPLLIDALLAGNATDPAALSIAAMFEYLRGQEAPAWQHAGEALRLNDSYVPALLMIGSLEAEAGRPSEAEAALRRVLEREPTHSRAALAVAQLRISGEDFDGARRVLREAADEDDAAADVLVELANLELKLGSVEAARAIALRLQEHFPMRPEGHLIEARLHQDAGRHSDAARAYEAAYYLQPSWTALSGRVSSLRAAGDDGWESILRARLESNPSDVAIRLLLAEGLQSTMRHQDALDEYEKLLAIDGDNVVALNNAAWLLNEVDSERALRYASRAVELAPDSAPVFDTLGWVQLRNGRADEALPNLEKAAQISPHEPEIRYHLAVAQSMTGNHRAAREMLQTLLVEERPFSSRDAAKALLNSLEPNGQ